MKKQKIYAKISLVAAFVLTGVITNFLMAQTATQKTITSSGTWQVPANVYEIAIEAIGGGGGGGFVEGRSDANYYVSGGGGGGAYAKKNSYAVNPGDVLTITIGAAGYSIADATSGGLGYNNRQTVDGGTTEVKLGSTTLVKAVGGKTVTGENNLNGAQGGQKSACVGDVTHSGGNGGTALRPNSVLHDLFASGGGGGAGYISADGRNGGSPTKVTRTVLGVTTWRTTTNFDGGAAWGDLSGAGGNGVMTFNNTGKGGGAYGGGGGGSKGGVAFQWHSGGYGKAGVVRITYSTVDCDLTPGTISSSEWNCSSSPVVNLTNVTAATGSYPASCAYSWEYSTDGSSWSPISGTTEANTVSTSGLYRRNYSRSGCETVHSNVIEVTHPDEADYGIATVSGKTDTNICKGNTVTLELDENTSYTVQWQMSADNGSSWSNITSPYTVTVSQDYKIRYMASYSSTCKRPSNNTFSINAKDKPVVNSITAPTDKCPGQTAYSVTGNITPGAGAITEYTWTGATGSSNVGEVSATLPNCGTLYNYSLKVKDEFGCESAVTNGSFSTTSPTVTFGTVPTQSAILAGSNCVVPNLKSVIESVASSTCSNPVVSYTCIPTEGSIVPDGSTINVTATVTDFCGNTHTVVIPVKADACAPSSECPLNITADNITVCEGTSATLTATASGTGATGTATYTWTPTTVTVINADGNEVTTPTTATPGSATYTCEVSFTSGCTSSKSIQITTIEKPVESNRTGEICTGESYSYGTSGVTYTWTVTDAAGTDATAQATAQSQFDVTLNNTGTASAVVIYSVTPHKTVGTTDCTGDPFTVTLTVKPSIANDASFTFNAPEVNITLWNGACDTLYNFATEPTYSTSIGEYSSSLTLTNNYSTSNTGTLMGRIPQGTNTITWTVTDPCGNSLTFPQNIIVNYQPCTGTVSDGEYTYDVVRVGCECWTASNSRKSATKTFVYKSPEFPDETANEEKFGKLYTWYSAVGVTEDDDNATPTETTDPTSGIKYVQGICPTGWAIPSASSYDNMIATAGGTDNVKSFDATTWLPGYAGNNPGSGFNAKGAGYYNNDIDRYENILSQTDFWTVSTGATVQNGICSEITHTCPQSLTKSYDKGRGFSVRCVKRAN